MDTQQSILVIEDQIDISELIKMQLEMHGYKVDTAINLSSAKSQINLNTYNMFLVDRMLPDGTGIEMCKYIRKNPSTKTAPIIFVTALSEPENIIEGLDAGANDYITKPFDINVLQARVRANLRQANPKNNNLNEYLSHGISLNEEKKEVKVESETISLTLTEYQILVLLMKEPGVVHSRASLIVKILGDDIHVTDRIIDTHMVGLRKKLKMKAKFIETIRGIGYRFKDNE
jgi:DNA-binding response OmpR family regulator